MENLRANLEILLGQQGTDTSVLFIPKVGKISQEYETSLRAFIETKNINIQEDSLPVYKVRNWMETNDFSMLSHFK
ncbi:hypothetical protein [Larkinella sp.]|uniref:hypothetical protein n=1 Tax=Larkinella sp. TaxID=2034517 RepID=UPI003BAB5854